MCPYRLQCFVCDFLTLNCQNIFFGNTLNQCYIYRPIPFLPCHIVRPYLCFFRVVLPNFLCCQIHAALLKYRQFFGFFFHMAVNDFRKHLLNFSGKRIALKPLIFLCKNMAFINLPFGNNAASCPKISLLI